MVHVDGSVDPIRDIEIIEAELIMADYQTVENRFRLIKAARGDKLWHLLRHGLRLCWSI